MTFLHGFFLLAVLTTTPAVAAEFRVVCLGDSITGPGPENTAGFAAGSDSIADAGAQRDYLNQYSKYADLLQLVLETHLGEGRVVVVNRGWAGNTSSQALARVDSSVVPLHPQIVTVLIGGNDFGGGDTEAVKQQLHANLSAIVDKCRKAGAHVLLLEYAAPRAHAMSKVWTHLDAGNPIIAQVAREQDVPTLELAPAFDAAAKTHPLADLASPIDGVHYNPYGEIVTARAIYFKLRELGWLPQHD
jgi:lysophospholipase L1-like esterase